VGLGGGRRREFPGARLRNGDRSGSNSLVLCYGSFSTSRTVLCSAVMYSGYEAVLQVRWASGKCRSLQPLEIVWVCATCSLDARRSEARSSLMACSLALVAFLIF